MRDPFVPIHVIGGIADQAALTEVHGLARGASACGAIGVSLYDAPITAAAKWLELTHFSGRARSTAFWGSPRSTAGGD
jgi:hypothetical protein